RGDARARGNALAPSQPTRKPARETLFRLFLARGLVLLVVHELAEDLALRPGCEAIDPGRASRCRRVRPHETVVAVLEAQRHPLAPARLLASGREHERPVGALARVEHDAVPARQRAQ